MRTVRLLVMLGLMQGLQGCGQKGPLVLPDAQHPHKKAASSKPPQARTPATAPYPNSSAPPQP